MRLPLSLSSRASGLVLLVKVEGGPDANDAGERDDAQDLEPRLGCGEEQEAEDEDGCAN